jgi:hypothetical protein
VPNLRTRHGGFDGHGQRLAGCPTTNASIFHSEVLLNPEVAKGKHFAREKNVPRIAAHANARHSPKKDGTGTKLRLRFPVPCNKCHAHRRILGEVSTQRCEPSEVHPDHRLLRDPQAKTVHETIKRNQRAKD